MPQNASVVPLMQRPIERCFRGGGGGFPGRSLFKITILLLPFTFHSACGGFPPAPEAIKPSPWFLRMPVLHRPPQVLGLT